MKQLLLLRHAKAVPSSPSGDFERELAPRGRKDAARIGAYLQAEGLVPEHILISPARRTTETADLVREAFSRQPPLEGDRTLYLAEPHAIIEAIRATEPEIDRLLVVGHNPGLHDLAVRLIASGDVETRERVNEKLPTSGLVVIDLPFDDWSRLHANAGRLERFVTPRLIDAASD